MPPLNGFEATEAIPEKEREHGGHAPIVAITAHAAKEDEQRCLAASVNRCLTLEAFLAGNRLGQKNPGQRI